MDMRSLFRRQSSTGLWIAEHGPYASHEDADDARRYEWLDCTVGICVSDDGRTLVTDWPTPSADDLETLYTGSNA